MLPGLVAVVLSGCASGGLDGRGMDAGTAAVVLTSISEPERLPVSTVVPLRRRGGYLLVDAAIHQVDVGPMLIDTGASLGVVAQGVAGRLKLAKTRRGRTVGVGGFEDFDFVAVGELTLGGGLGLVPGDRAALNLRRFGAAMGEGVTGIVGFTDLASAPFTLDAAARTLTVYRPSSFRPPRDTPRERLYLFRGLPVVRAEIRSAVGPIEVDLLIDSGANRAVTLPDTLLRDHPKLAATRFAGRGRTLGVGGAVTSTETWLGQIRVFGLHLEALPVAFEPPPPGFDRGPRPMGRIGNQLLQHLRLTFDAPRGWVYARWAEGEAEGGVE